MRRLFALLSLLALLATPAAADAAYPVETNVLRAVAEHIQRPWAPPAGADIPCELTPAHPRPVVLVHGTFVPPVIDWSGLAPYLANEGFCVFAPRYGMYHGLPGNGNVRRSAGELAAAVDAVLARYPAGTKVDLVGHSQGGMMPRYYLRFLGGTAKVHRLVGIAPSNHGTTIFGLTSALRTLGLVPGVALISPAVKDQLRGSALLRDLNAGDETPGDVRYDVIAPKYDEVVTPYTSQRVDGASWWVIQNGCSRDLSEHLQIVYSPRLHAKVANLLDGGSRPLPCRYVPPAGLG